MYKKKFFIFTLVLIASTLIIFGAHQDQGFAKTSKRQADNRIHYRVDNPANLQVIQGYKGRLTRLLLSPDKNTSVTVYQKPNPKKLSLEDWADKKFAVGGHSSMHKEGEVTIDGVTGLKYSGNLHGDSTFIFVSYKDNVLEIEYYTPPGQRSSHSSDFESVLPNVKLID